MVKDKNKDNKEQKNNEGLQTEPTETVPAQNTKVVLDEKNEVDLHELQIKLERLKSYLVKVEGRYKKHEKELELLRAKKEQVEGQRRDTALVYKSKLDGKA